MAKPVKPVDYEAAWKFFRSIGSPKNIVAPMVNQSELAFRQLCRRYKADLCFTPMLHARLFATDPKYRLRELEAEAGGPTDRPLIVQFCANDSGYLLQASKLVQDRCDAVDINLGCPQGIARKGHYGSFLLEEWDLVTSMVRTLHQNLDIPVTCKIRILPDAERTLELAKLLQEAGCAMLTVHGRTKEMLKERLGPCDFEIIRRIKEELSIPVISNGGIETKEDVAKCLELTKADGVMVSEGILGNPRIFQTDTTTLEHTLFVAQEYIDLVKATQENLTTSKLRGHLFKILYPFIMGVPSIQKFLASQDVAGMTQVVVKIRERYAEAEAKGESLGTYPSWYVRHTAKSLPKPKLPQSDESKTTEKQCPGCTKTLPRSSFSTRGWKHAKGRCINCSNAGGIVGNFKCPQCSFSSQVFEATWNHLLSTRHFFPVCAVEDGSCDNPPAIMHCLACGEAFSNLKKFCRHVSRKHKKWVERICDEAFKGEVSAERAKALIPGADSNISQEEAKTPESALTGEAEKRKLEQATEAEQSKKQKA